ncbi:MAG: sterol desaturase family protein [Cyclobacteriaceae bacterium]|jgi:sterol desaturase/sphingolipid hydroxylase (fatty acid hydroxylase superfamily)|nr:sterol desaturase family protein [Cyclobacteriaceae bacterium]
MEATYTADIKPQNRGTKQLFQSPVLEKLSRTHISVPLAIFGVYAAALLYWSITHTSLSPLMTSAMFGIGFVAFTWVEYNTHRHIFHMKIYTETRKKIQYLIHGVHHEFPKDKERLAMPPLVSITIATLLLLIFRVLMGDLVFSFLPGFLVGYAYYLSVHYLVHAYPPPKNFLKVLWVNHGIHHYKNGEVVFGVSSPFWDHVYGTMKTKEDKAAAAPHHHPH